jgi:hypothetical protein
MTIPFYDRVKIFTGSLGTGAVIAGAALSGYRTPAQAAIPDGAQVALLITKSNGEWEISTGVWGASGSSFSRTLRASSTGSLLNLDGTGVVTVTLAAAEASSFLTSADVTAALPQAYPWRNRIINGDMRIDQRHAGATINASSTTYILDRWVIYASLAGKVSGARAASPAALAAMGFNYALLATSLSAYAPAGTDATIISQSVEGVNVVDLLWGTANAKPLTVSFLAYSSLTGTFSGAIRNGPSNRSYPFTFNIAAANTPTAVAVTIPGDTAGTWASDNTAGLQLNINLGTGPTNLGPAGAWAASGYVGVTGSVNLIATNGATFYLTGVQAELGSVASAFERRLYAIELALCQRYYAKSYDTATAPGASTEAGATEFVAQATTAFQLFPTIRFPATMRAAPTLVAYSTTGASNAYRDIDAGADIAGAGTTTGLGQGSGHIQLTGSSAVAGHRYGVHWTAEAEL